MPLQRFLRLGDGGGDTAVVQIWCQGHKARLSQPVGHLFDVLIETPPGMQNQNARPFSAGWHGQMGFCF
jgi:hypothetical protein